ncbi:MAG: DNA methyltransferase [Gemmatimonadetes bacterium]|nr:DNA methyltransferase [Gemmatimonadota bacterium]MYE71584.1 DNA methyltransferase [Gemmatimonadota bacterium]MYJ67924.1 DNA methyltransferase [Gemmatimonadota bacterium]
MSRVAVTKAVDPNRMRPDDRPVHDWYRFVLSFPPHLVRDYLERLGVGAADTVLDPFCGTGTTLVECKKRGVDSVGLERNPMAHFASSVKVEWSVDPERLAEYSDAVAQSAKATLIDEGVDDWADLPLLTANGPGPASIRTLEPSRFKLLLKNSISPVPLHKTLVTLDAVDRLGDPQVRAYGRLALATGLVRTIGNLRFGPEVGVGRIKPDASVVDIWRANMKTILTDIRALSSEPVATARVLRADARDAEKVLPPQSIDAVITSPPYPNEKDYTRTTRLESVILGFIRHPKDLRALKRDMVRSNTRGVYRLDDDDIAIEAYPEIGTIADEIERRRVALGKTSGFERMYARVVKLYFGGMARHLASLRTILRPGARLAYVVGDQASYLRVMIRTGQLLGGIAQSLGYEVIDIDLFRTRLATATRAQLREEVLLLRWPGASSSGAKDGS